MIKVFVRYIRHLVCLVDIAVSQKELSVLRYFLAFVLDAISSSFRFHACHGPKLRLRQRNDMDVRCTHPQSRIPDISIVDERRDPQSI